LKLVNAVYVALAVAAMILIAIAAFTTPYPACVELGSPLAYRNIYLHIPVAIASYAAYTAAMIAAIVYIVKRSVAAASYAHRAIGAGIILSIATLITGSFWAAESWGTPWNWDPRETAVLFLTLAYMAYYAVRASIRDPEAALRVSMAYAVAAYATVPLSFLAPYIFPSLHPKIVNTASYFAGGLEGTKILFPLILFSLLIVTLLSPIAKPGRAAVAAAGIVLVIGAAAALAMTIPWSSCSLHGRVVSAALQGGEVILTIKTGQGIVKLPVSLSKLGIKPPLLHGSQAAECWSIIAGHPSTKPWPTILGHIVCVKPFHILYPVCLVASVVMDALAIAALLLLSKKYTSV